MKGKVAIFWMLLVSVTSAFAQDVKSMHSCPAASSKDENGVQFQPLTPPDDGDASTYNKEVPPPSRQGTTSACKPFPPADVGAFKKVCDDLKAKGLTGPTACANYH